MQGDKPLKNTRHELFCQARVKGKTEEEAYKAAGYQTTTQNAAYVGASYLLRNPNIQDRIAFLQGKGTDKHQAEVEELKDFFSEVMNNKENKLADRLKAAELKGKMLGTFTTNTRISGGDGGAVILKWKQPK